MVNSRAGSQRDAESDSESNSDGELEVERIIDMRTNKDGQKEFFLKWKGFKDTENSWEPENNLDCPELVRAFVEDYKRRAAAKPRTSSGEPQSKARRPENVVEVKKTPNGFARGLQPQLIVGATEEPGYFAFCVKWEGSDDCEIVSAEECNRRCPQLVIRFYQERIVWRDKALTSSANVKKLTVVVDTTSSLLYFLAQMRVILSDKAQLHQVPECIDLISEDEEKPSEIVTYEEESVRAASEPEAGDLSDHPCVSESKPEEGPAAADCEASSSTYLTHVECCELLTKMYNAECIDKTQLVSSLLSVDMFTPFEADSARTALELMNGFFNLHSVAVKHLTLRQYLESVKYYLLHVEQTQYRRRTLDKNKRNLSKQKTEGAQALMAFPQVTRNCYVLFRMDYFQKYEEMRQYDEKSKNAGFMDKANEARKAYAGLTKEEKHGYEVRIQTQEQEFVNLLNKLIVKHGVIELMGAGSRSMKVMKNPFTLYLMWNFDARKRENPDKSDRKLRKELLAEFNTLSIYDPRYRHRTECSERNCLLNCRFPFPAYVRNAAPGRASSALQLYSAQRPKSLTIKCWKQYWYHMDHKTQYLWNRRAETKRIDSEVAFANLVSQYLATLPDCLPLQPDRVQAETALSRESIRLYKTVEPVLKYYRCAASYRHIEITPAAADNDCDLNSDYNDHTTDLLNLCQRLTGRLSSTLQRDDRKENLYKCARLKLVAEGEDSELLEMFDRAIRNAVEYLPMSMILSFMLDYIVRTTGLNYRRHYIPRAQRCRVIQMGFSDTEATRAFVTHLVRPPEKLETFYIREKLQKRYYERGVCFTDRAQYLEAVKKYRRKFKRITADEKRMEKLKIQYHANVEDYKSERNRLLAKFGYEDVAEYVLRHHQIHTCFFTQYLRAQLPRIRAEMPHKSDRRLRKRLLKRYYDATADVSEVEFMYGAGPIDYKALRPPVMRPNRVVGNKRYEHAKTSRQRLRMIKEIVEIIPAEIAEMLPELSLSTHVFFWQKTIPTMRKTLKQLSRRRRERAVRSYARLVDWFRRKLKNYLSRIEGPKRRAICENQLMAISPLLARLIRPVCQLYVDRPTKEVSNTAVVLPGHNELNNEMASSSCELRPAKRKAGWQGKEEITEGTEMEYKRFRLSL